MIGFILLIASYILGSIPFGFLVASRIKKIDIRNFGSGNIGATNVFRVVGKTWGILVFVLDFLKGLAAPCLTACVFSRAENLIILSAILVVCGHNWTVFLHFKGGKGVAVSLGAVTGLSFIFPQLWIVLIASLVVWTAAFLIFKYVSLASLAASITFCVLSLVNFLPWKIKFFSFLLFIFIIVRHKKNIKNLITKKENRF